MMLLLLLPAAPCPRTGAVTCDAHHMTDPHPDGLGVSTCIKLALKDSKIERDEVGGYLVMGESLRACC